MLYECSKCGAPIDATSGRRVVECPYCHYHNRVAQTRQLAATTPQDFRPPPTWTPPQTAQAAGTELTYRAPRQSRAALVAAFAFFALASAGGSVAFLVSQPTLPADLAAGAAGVPAARVMALGPGIDRATAAATLGVEIPAGRDDLHFAMQGAPFGRAGLGFEDPEGHALTSLHLYADAPVAERAGIEAALEAALGRRLERYEDGRRHYSLRGAHVGLSADGAHLYFDVDVPETARWRERVALLWSLLWGAASGQAPAEDPRRRAELVGSPLGALETLDVDAALEGATAAVEVVAVAWDRSVMIDVSYVIALDHPLLDRVSLDWQNDAGGKLDAATLYGHYGGDDAADQRRLVACLAAALGPPEERVTSYAEGTRNYEWRRSREPGRVLLSSTHVTVSFGDVRGRRGADARAKERWVALVRALAPCGGP